MGLELSSLEPNCIVSPVMGLRAAAGPGRGDFSSGSALLALCFALRNVFLLKVEILEVDRACLGLHFLYVFSRVHRERQAPRR